MKLYGRNAIANSQLFNPEFIHFFIPGMGSLPYVVADIYNRVVVSVIGDPLTHPSNWRRISEMFVKEFPDTYFYHASKEYAQVRPPACLLHWDCRSSSISSSSIAGAADSA
jgi:hypothetical protein